MPNPSLHCAGEGPPHDPVAALCAGELRKISRACARARGRCADSRSRGRRRPAGEARRTRQAEGRRAVRRPQRRESVRADQRRRAGARRHGSGVPRRRLRLVRAKVHAPADVSRIDAHLNRIERAGERVVLVPMLEDPGAVLDARKIAAASARGFALVAGSEDMATAMGAEPTPEVLRLPKLLVHLAAKAAGLRSFGMLRSVADFKDAEAVAASAREARAFGFDGASCIHPSVVPILNAAFSPTREEIERARRMVAAFAAARAAGQGALVFAGKMVDEPVVARARALLARAGQEPSA